MSRYYVKSRKEYDEPSEFDEKKILEAMKKAHKGKKQPTSVALEKSTIAELKKLGDRNGVPYQVLMRMFILDGIRRMKK